MTTPRNNAPIIEFIQQGRFVKVTAIDPETGMEAVIVGDAARSDEILAREAVRKLERLLHQGE